MSWASSGGGSGSSNASLYLVGRNAGTGYSTSIIANQLGGISIQPVVGRPVGVGLNPSSGAGLQIYSNAAVGFPVNTAAPTNGLVVSGSVGIGTLSPTATLQVSGTFIVSNSATPANPTIFTDSSGNVGFGTPYPSTSVHIVSDSGLRVQASSSNLFFGFSPSVKSIDAFNGVQRRR